MSVPSGTGTVRRLAILAFVRPNRLRLMLTIVTAASVYAMIAVAAHAVFGLSWQGGLIPLVARWCGVPRRRNELRTT